VGFELREYQVEGVENLRASFKAGKRAPLYVLPTGGGKTAVFSYIAENAVARKRRVGILVHRHELLMQASRSLTKLGVAHGLISPKFTPSRDAVQVASVQALARRLGDTPPLDLIIVDECHHSVSPTYKKILAANPKAHVLGVTATPCRTNGAGLDEIFDDLVLGPSVAELIRLGYLVKPTVYAPPIGIDLEGVKKQMGDYDKRELGKRVDQRSITGNAVEHYQRYAGGEPGIVFCVSVAHADHVATEFQRAGIKARRVDGGMSDANRRAAIEGLGSGEVDLLVSADLIGEGVDIPRVSVAILLRPTQSLSLYLQQVGRALRPYPGKSRALILDHVGNVMRHGFPDEDRKWTLEGTRRRRKLGEGASIKITQCGNCYFVYETGPERCPACLLATPGKPREILEEEGELAELDRAKLEAARNRKREEGQAKTYDDLLIIERARGYKPGWARHRFNARGRR
jgi:DNA repair protein RadD